MDRAAILGRTERFVRRRLTGEPTGHDWWHVERVRALSRRLGSEEEADPFVVELAALLHDIADWKFHAGDTEAGPQAARAWLKECGVEVQVIEHVCRIVRHLSFKGSDVPTPMDTIEGKVVQDADRLDALGAIGIARAFAFGGRVGSELYNPEVSPLRHQSFDSYRESNSSTINHFYEKLLLLKDRMNTRTGKRMAAQRHDYMERFLEQFDHECKGEK